MTKTRKKIMSVWLFLICLLAVLTPFNAVKMAKADESTQTIYNTVNYNYSASMYMYQSGVDRYSYVTNVPNAFLSFKFDLTNPQSPVFTVTRVALGSAFSYPLNLYQLQSVAVDVSFGGGGTSRAGLFYTAIGLQSDNPITIPDGMTVSYTPSVNGIGVNTFATPTGLLAFNFNVSNYNITIYAPTNANITNGEQYFNQYVPFGFTDDVSYNSIYNRGYNEGYNDGANGQYNNGYNDGYNEGISRNNTFLTFFTSIADSQWTIFKSIFNFNILGVNLFEFIQAVLVFYITVKIVMLIRGGGA